MRCSSCGAEFTQWMGFIPLRHAFARELTKLWHAVLLLALFTSLGFLIPALLSLLLQQTIEGFLHAAANQFL